MHVQSDMMESANLTMGKSISPLASDAPPTPGATDTDSANLDLTQIQSATMLPEQLLQPGEVIIVLLKPSPWYIVLASLRALALIGVGLILTFVLNGYGWIPIAHRDLITIGIGTTCIRLFWQFLQWLSHIYVLTDRRMIRIKGVVRVHVFECQLTQIQHTNLLFSLRERVFGLGTIGFATAGTAASEAFWLMIARPLDVHHQLVQTLNRYR